MELGIHLSPLYALICQYLIVTNKVKDILRLQCNEARFVLKPWCVRLATCEERSNATCICKEDTYTSQIEELAAGVTKTLSQTRQLREELSVNVLKDKNPFNVYNNCKKSMCKLEETCNTAHSNNAKIRKNSNQLKQEHKLIPNVTLNRLSSNDDNVSIDSIVYNIPTTDSEHNKNHMLHEQIIPKKLLQSAGAKACTSNLGNKMSKSVLNEQKNFVRINKLSIKAKEQLRKEQVAGSSSSSVSKVTFSKQKLSNATSIATKEIDKLKQQLISGTCNIIASSINASNSQCPVHGNDQSEMFYKDTSTLLDVAEAIETLSLPGVIVKTLKIYHSYLEMEPLNYILKDSKCRNTKNTFLIEFEKLNDMQDYLMEKTSTTYLVLECMPLLKTSFLNNMGSSHLENIKKSYTELKTVCKMHNIRKSLVKKQTLGTSNTSSENAGITSLMSSGVWSNFCIHSIKGISRVRCIQYLNDEQLLLFYKTLQLLQQTQYFNTVNNLIFYTIIPKLKSFSHNVNDDYIQIYKMSFVLYQGLHPKVPVLVRVNK